MSRLSLLIVGTSSVLIACGGGGGGSATQGATFAGVRIMPLGDSITYGESVVGGYRLPLRNRLAAKLPFTYVGSLTTNSKGLDRPDHEGRRGWTLLDFIGEGAHYGGNGPVPVTRFVQAARPDLILLLLGTNDGPVGEAEFERRYRKLLDEIYAVQPNVKIAFMEVLPHADGDGDVGVQARDAAVAVTGEFQAQGKAIQLVDPHGSFDGQTMLTDGVHPNAAGYDTIAGLFEPAVESLTQ